MKRTRTFFRGWLWLALLGCSIAGLAAATHANAADSLTPARLSQGDAAPSQADPGIATHADAAAADTWPQVQRDASHSGYAPQTVGPPYRVLWQRSPLPPVSSRVQPIIAEGLIFLPSNDYSLYALYASSGQTAWTHRSGGPLVNSAAYDSGMVFFGSTDHYLYAVRSSDGGLVWRYQTGGTIKSAPVVADGKVFVGSSNGCMYALNQATGTPAWSTPTCIGAPIFDTAAYDGGRVFFGGMNSRGYALDAGTGQIAWSVPIPGQGFRDRWTVAGLGKVFFTPMLYGNHHDALNDGTAMFSSSHNPPLYNQSWYTQRLAIVNYLASNPYKQPVFVVNQSNGAIAFTPPILYASGGSLSPHSQPVLLPNGNANVIYRRSFGEAALYGQTTNDALYTGELVLSNGDILPVDRCVRGQGGWNNCGNYKSWIISDESVALSRAGAIIYLNVSRGIVGLDTTNQVTIRFVSFSPEAFATFPIEIQDNLDYDNLHAEVDSDGNDINRPVPIVGNVFYVLRYDTLVAVEGTLR